MSPSERSWLKEYLDAEFDGIKLQLQALIDYNEAEKKEKELRIKSCNERFTALENTGGTCSPAKVKKKIVVADNAPAWKRAAAKLLEVFLNMLSSIVQDVTNSRVWRYSFIILILGIGFTAARNAGIFELGIVKDILAYLLKMKVQ